MTIKEEEDAALDSLECLISERVEVTDALFTFAMSSLEEERKRRVRAINALVALGHIQDGYRYPVRGRKQPPLVPVQRAVSEPLSLECKPRNVTFAGATERPPLTSVQENFIVEAP
jgi:hypothetical protein